MAIVYNTNRFRTKSGQKYYLTVDNTPDNETYSAYSYEFDANFDTGLLNTGPVTGISVNSSGSGGGYSVASNVPTITNGRGTGFTVNITGISTGGAITAIAINSAGINYHAGDTITVVQSGAYSGIVTASIINTAASFNYVPTGTLMYTESLTNGITKGPTDDLINDNATLIDSYGSIKFLNTTRDQVTKWIISESTKGGQ